MSVGKFKRFMTGTAVAALAVSAAGCADDGPAPEPAAKKLAAALSSTDISKVPFANAAGGKADQRLADITAELGHLKPKVSVADVEIDEDDDDAATAKLRYSWDFAGNQDWSYTTNAELVRGGQDKWHPNWSPAVVAPGLKQGQTLAVRSTQPDRAEIRGSDGETLTAAKPIRATLDQAYDKRLGGTAGMTVEATGSGSGSGSESGPRVLFESDPKQGKALQTTLDRDLQQLAENVLTAEDSASSIVAIRPSSGEVLAAADGPTGSGYPNSIVGQFPPGSTFKIATSLGLIRQGMTPESTVSCTEKYQGFQNAPTYPQWALGEIPLKLAVAQSCNTAFISESGTVSQQDLSSAAAALGIGAEADLGFPAFLGSVPAKADPAMHAVSMFGQGEVQVSPLALATMGASVGEGDRVTPKLVKGEGGSIAGDGSGGEPTESAKPGKPDAGTKPVTEEEAAMLRTMMRGVVTQGGATMLQDTPGPPVIAKTGTAEFGSETPPKTHAWMVAVHGDLAVAVFVEEGEYGSTSGGPLMEAFLEGATSVQGGQ